MLKHLRLEGFKSWKTLDMEFAPVTAIFGPNSSGKSSILQFLLLLKQTYESRDPTTVLDFGGDGRGLVDLDGFWNATHDKLGIGIFWSLNWQLPEILQIEDPGIPGSFIDSANEITISARVRLAMKFPSVSMHEILTKALSYEFGSQKFSLLHGKSGYTLHSKGYEFKMAQETSPSSPELSLPGPIRSYAFPDRVRSAHKNAGFLSHLEVKYTEMMDRIYYLGPLREQPQRHYQWTVKKPRDVGARGENTIDAILAAGNLENQNGEDESSEFQEHLAAQLREMGMLDDFSIGKIPFPFSNAVIYIPRATAPNSTTSTNLPDVGFGVSQVLPVVVLLNYVPEGSTVLLEQPEIHLHPAVQSALGDVIINAMQSRNLQIIVESHSEHLLRRLQRRIAEEKAPSEKMRLYFTEMQDGQSVATRLDLDEYGYINNWPENFFGDEFGEVCAAQEAALKRQLKENK